MAKIGEVFQEVKKADPHPKKNFRWIHYTKLHQHPKQYRIGATAEEKELFQTRVEELAWLIKTDGKVLQNLVVRKTGPDEYEIIAGHHRWYACKMLVEEGLTQFEFLPCDVENISDVRAEFELYSTNGFDNKTDFEVMHELERMKFLISNYPAEFPDMQTGRMVERLAKKTGRKRSTVGEYLKISKNLGKEAMQQFQTGKIDKSAAVELASFPEEEQVTMIKQGITKRKDIRKYKEEKDVPKVGTFPDLKNMEERENFVKAYKSWHVWCENKYTEETFYRYDLPDGSAIVVKEYPYSLEWNPGRELSGTEFYLLLPETKHFNSAKSNMTAIKEHLKDVRRR